MVCSILMKSASFFVLRVSNTRQVVRQVRKARCLDLPQTQREGHVVRFSTAVCGEEHCVMTLKMATYM